MAKTRLLIKNACYHIYARGNQKQKIFSNSDDFKFYLYQLRRYKRKFSFLLYGYCLMPNHIHLIGKPIVPENLSKFMQCLQRSYTAYYNNKYEKTGHLWQGRFKMKVIAEDNYLIDCIAYIEENPVRANLAITPKEYEFSSYRERNLKDTDFNILDEILLYE
ncbi:MAG: transposase [Candidatus Omnitrophica bacterium]|nr:transposase [Candidatus Omnitrophota bacterium]